VFLEKLSVLVLIIGNPKLHQYRYPTEQIMLQYY